MNHRFRQRLVPIVDAVLEESYHHLLHCFQDVRSLAEPVARIEEIQRVLLHSLIHFQRLKLAI